MAHNPSNTAQSVTKTTRAPSHRASAPPGGHPGTPSLNSLYSFPISYPSRPLPRDAAQEQCLADVPLPVPHSPPSRPDRLLLWGRRSLDTHIPHTHLTDVVDGCARTRTMRGGVQHTSHPRVMRPWPRSWRESATSISNMGAYRVPTPGHAVTQALSRRATLWTPSECLVRIGKQLKLY